MSGGTRPSYNRVLTAATYASAAASLLLALWWALRRRMGAPARVPQRLEQVAGLVVAGVATNALVCATAASWLDRFQSRVIWLLPFLALTVLAMAWSRRQADATAIRAGRSRSGRLQPAAATASMQGAA